MATDERAREIIAEAAHTARTMAETFGEPIYIYTRAQAIADGVLVDVTETAREAGFRFPVALTAAAWADCVAWTAALNKQHHTCNDEAGRLWDVVWMATFAARRFGHADNQMFQLHRVPRDGHGHVPRQVTLRITRGPGDNGEPVITIMLPNED